MIIRRMAGVSILLILLLAMVALSSCSTPMGIREELDEVTMAYGDTVRWKKFETASLFAASSIRDEFEARVRNAKNVVVVDYRIISAEYDEAQKKATVNAEISYYTFSSMRVRTIIDKQIWLYSEENGSKQWRLTSLLPEFK